MKPDRDGWLLAGLAASCGLLALHVVLALRGSQAAGSAELITGIAALLLLGGALWVLWRRRAARIASQHGAQLRLAESALRERTAVLRAISEETTDLIFVKDADSRLIFANPVTLRVLGMSEAEAIGKNEAERNTDPAEGEAIRANDRRIMASGVAEAVEEVHTGPHGTRLYLSTKAPLRDESGRVVGVIGIGRDITERKRTEIEMRETAERLGLALGAAGMGTWEWNIETDHLVCSPEALALFGIPLDTQVTFEAFFSMVLSEDVPAIQRAKQDAVESGHYQMEYRIRRPDGAVRWISATGRRLGATGPRMIGVISDITERMAAAEALREADRRKDEFLATLAHELRNPLAPIRNGLEILGTSDDPVAVGRQREMMERQLGHLVRLIDDLLDVGRIRSGKLALRRERIELASVVEQALETCRASAEAEGREIAVALPDAAIPLDADAVRLTQVFGNLLHNACKFTRPGGNIRLSATRDGDQARVAIRDDGVGISVADQEQIFELFAQGLSRSGHTESGLGIGLTLVKNLVELHGGSIEVHSEGTGSGSEFVVRLPIAAGDAPHAKPLERADVAHGPSLRILVVDDNRDAADSLAMVLRLAAHDTYTVYDGPDGVEAAARLDPDVVLLDIGLPTLDGYAACRQIRQQPGGARRTIFALTGWGQDEDRARSAAAGFDAHLVKPVDPLALRQRIATLRPGDAGRLSSAD